MNNENHKKLRIPWENNANAENHRIPIDNNKNNRIPKILIEYQENILNLSITFEIHCNHRTFWNSTRELTKY